MGEINRPPNGRKLRMFHRGARRRVTKKTAKVDVIQLTIASVLKGSFFER